MSSLTRLIAAPCLVATLALLAAAPSGSAATSLKTCSIKGKEQKLGATYVTKLKVRGVTCATGESIVKAFQSCRHRKGAKGRCTSRVKGYRCTETRPAQETIPTQFTGHATCRRGARRVDHVYQQNT